MRFLLSATAGICVGLTAYLLFWPVKIDPKSWEPPPVPNDGSFAAAQPLNPVERLEFEGRGPETIAIDTKGNIYTGLEDGRIIRFPKYGGMAETFVNTGGRPLGMKFSPFGDLIVCDSYKGLLSISLTGKITTLSTEADGKAFRLTDDLDIASNGLIYFSDASHKFNQADFKADALEHRPNGRLLVYNPENGETTTLLKDLYFANGVTLTPDENSILIVETWKYRVTRLWLRGEKQGQTEVFVDQLPGFPDNISYNGKGVYWLAMAAPRDPVIDLLADQPFWRKVLIRLPRFLWPQAQPQGFILGFNEGGKVLYNLQGPKYSHVTSVHEYHGSLYLGSLQETAIGRLPLKSL